MKFVVCIFSLIILGGLNHAYAQKAPSEDSLLLQVDFTDHTFDPRRPDFLFVGKSAITKYNPLSLTLGGLLFVYQKAISPQLQSHCPYEISCSAFSKACIEEFGIIKGVALTADRLGRCTQFTLIDIQQSQINERDGSIIDHPHKYRLKHHGHDH